jgi:GntR family transcriptional repressor for pyruvate dehydrogenase complex
MMRKVAVNQGDKRSSRLFTPVKSTRKSDHVYQQLLDLIRGGRFRPGERLPSERHMAGELGISRQSVREALHRAELLGLVEVRPGEGTFVNRFPEATRIPHLSPSDVVEGNQLLELLQLRRIIEAWCVEKAVLTAKEPQLESIAAILAQHDHPAPVQSSWKEVDTEFHLALAQAAGNGAVVELIRSLITAFAVYFRENHVILRTEKANPLHVEHTELFAAIRQRNLALALHKTEEHLDHVEETIRTFLASRNP